VRQVELVSKGTKAVDGLLVQVRSCYGSDAVVFVGDEPLQSDAIAGPLSFACAPCGGVGDDGGLAAVSGGATSPCE
jgi:hypothetical protein